MRPSRLAILPVFTALLASGCLQNSDPRQEENGIPSSAPSPLGKSAANPNSYIVTLRDGSGDVDAAAADLAGRHGLAVGHVYHHALNGFSATVPPGRLADLVADPRVAAVEADIIAYATAQTLPWGIDRINTDVSSTLAGDGAGDVGGVRIYILDTGIRPDHPDLKVAGLRDFTGSGDGHDDNGHGTHVAGIAAGRDDSGHVVGGAPGAALYAVKVLGADGSGSSSGIVAGIDFVTGEKLANPGVPMVANMSLGARSALWTAIDAAVLRSVNAGVVYCIAAGNDGQDAKNFTPAHVDAAITVGAYDVNNVSASWSNYGSLVDLQAPGVNILSDWFDPAAPTKVLSGTSMATPHVTGTAALLLSRNPGMTPAQVRDRMVADGKAWVTGVRPKTTGKSVFAGTY